MSEERPVVVVVSPTPPPFSGPEVMTQQLLRSPLREKYKLIHFNISKGRDVSTKARFDLINVGYGLVQPLQLAWLMLRYKPSLVYTNLSQNPAGFLRYASFILLVRLFHKPVVVRVMGDGFNHFFYRMNRTLRWFVGLVLKCVGCFIVRAEALKKQFAGVIPSPKLRVVYSGIDIREFNCARTRGNDGEIRVLFVGYLTRAKGALDLLRAVPQVASRYHNIRFQFMGPPIDVERNVTYIDNPSSNTAEFQDLLSQPSMASFAELVGVRTGQQKIDTFVNADIFVLPSYAEAFPTVVLEAMAAGLPVIATPVGALPEVFDERNILFVDPGNIAQLATTICRLVENSALRLQMGANNQQTVRYKFDLSSYAARVDAVFRELLEAGNNLPARRRNKANASS